jgi:alkylation response protein AidB-like acyl-CoA dehydrogenase
VEFGDTPSEAAFRREVREWLEPQGERFTPRRGAALVDVVALARQWQAACADAGLAGFGLPEEIGGRPGPMSEQIIFHQETAQHPMAMVEMLVLGCGMALPTMLAHGTEAQVGRFGSPSIRGEILWCQLFSEPGAGSDVAGIRTQAVRDGDGWIVNGQKVWTSGAEFADWGLLLVRTDPTVPKHRGLTYFLVDMHGPGVETRPLRQLGGRVEFSEVFFTDVRIPDEMRVGNEGEGFRVAMTTLSNERLVVSGNPAVGRNLIEPLLRLATRVPGPDGRPLIVNAVLRERVASYYAVVAGIERIGDRIRTAVARGQSPGPEAAFAKAMLTRLLQEMAVFGMDILGPAAQVIDADADPDLFELQEGFFLAPGYRMGGGTEEITKNIIAERVLGLPPEYRPDRDQPFRQPAPERRGDPRASRERSADVA